MLVIDNPGIELPAMRPRRYSPPRVLSFQENFPMVDSEKHILTNHNSLRLLAISCSLMMSIGIIPLVLFKDTHIKYLHTRGKFITNLLAIYASGNLLGHVFFKIIPEIKGLTSEEHFRQSLMIILVGYCTMFLIDMLSKKSSQTFNSEGYSSIIANVLDNLAHGISLASAYTLGNKFGVSTTICLFYHEIPHEISDVIILIHSGFNRREALYAEIFTSSFIMIGAIVTLAFVNISDMVWIILSFVAGSFLYVSLTSILGDRSLQDSNQFLTKTFSLMSGVVSAFLF
ncbi:Zinc transporter ZIP13 [Thelohanellus kitauei]|uniref:Zinc transporter ZIP13 n=1 Tax=Thelohanellus kitauei TaxID=669202 RepID=A0A0C2MWQ0_THEKT|nr:Zinc transporter ZIP13 [Thelohanellus kitauei]